MPKFLAFLALLAAMPAAGATPVLAARTVEAPRADPRVPPGLPSTITRTVDQFDMRSRSSGRTYRIQVFTPSLPPPPQGYPVIMFTDAELTFNTAADQMNSRFLTDLKPAIVVGIGYPSPNLWDAVRLRNRDLIPWKPSGAFAAVFRGWGRFGGYTDADAGGAEDFFRFITQELRPRLAARSKIDLTQQALYGHSLGGLFTLYTLFEHPEAFTTYIVSSPSILVNERQIRQGMPGFKAAVEARRIAPRVLFLSGEHESMSPSALAALPDAERLGWTRMGASGVANTVEMADDLADYRGGPGYEVRRHVFAGENHTSVVPASIARALTFAFSVAPLRMRY